MGMLVGVGSPVMGRRAAQKARLSGFSLWACFYPGIDCGCSTAIVEVAGLCFQSMSQPGSPSIRVPPWLVVSPLALGRSVVSVFFWRLEHQVEFFRELFAGLLVVQQMLQLLAESWHVAQRAFQGD